MRKFIVMSMLFCFTLMITNVGYAQENATATVTTESTVTANGSAVASDEAEKTFDPYAGVVIENEVNVLLKKDKTPYYQTDGFIAGVTVGSVLLVTAIVILSLYCDGKFNHHVEMK